MVEEQALAEQAQPEEKSETRFEMRIDTAYYQHMKKVARYAAVEGVIPDDHRGNMTAWVNYCLAIGEEMLRKHAHQKKGF